MRRVALVLAMSYPILLAEVAQAHSVTVRDQGNCAFGFLTSTVTVDVDGQSYELSLSCKFYNDQSFSVGPSDNCRVTSGMCSDFQPQGSVTVSCDLGGGYASASVSCPSH